MITYDEFEQVNNKLREQGLRAYKIQCRNNTVYFSDNLNYFDSIPNVVMKVCNGEYCLRNPQKLKRVKYFKCIK